MAFQPVSSFEILSQPIAPLAPDVPYVQQGYFIQVTNAGGAAIKPSIKYIPSPAFVASVLSPFSPGFGPKPATINLFADYIDATGKANDYPLPAPDFLGPPFIGFKAATLPKAINPGETFLFGVQYILNTAAATYTATSGGTPQDSIETRGYAEIDVAAPAKLYVLATVRQLFTNYGPNGTILDFADGAYAPPLISGTTLTF
jgi:hypothetical protein